MGFQQIRAKCRHCKEFVLATKPSFKHGPYLTASAITLGMFAPVYLAFYWMKSAPFRCTHCGLALKDGTDAATLVSIGLGALIGLGIWGGVLLTFLFGKR